MFNVFVAVAYLTGGRGAICPPEKLNAKTWSPFSLYFNFSILVFSRLSFFCIFRNIEILLLGIAIHSGIQHHFLGFSLYVG